VNARCGGEYNGGGQYNGGVSMSAWLSVAAAGGGEAMVIRRNIISGSSA